MLTYLGGSPVKNKTFLYIRSVLNFTGDLDQCSGETTISPENQAAQLVATLRDPAEAYSVDMHRARYYPASDTQPADEHPELEGSPTDERTELEESPSHEPLSLAEINALLDDARCQDDADEGIYDDTDYYVTGGSV